MHNTLDRGRLGAAARRAAALVVVLAALPGAARAQLLPASSPERCTAATATASAAAWLTRAAAAVLPPADSARILRFRASHDVPLWEQSDRMYEPHIPNATLSLNWYDPRTGVAARQPLERPLPLTSYPAQLFTIGGTFAGRDTSVTAFPASVAASRPTGLLNPWLVLSAWKARAGEATVTQRCRYRDAWRVVLALGTERLYLSESDAVPIKLERIEPHYLWGQVRAEYLWSTWWGVVGGGQYPNAAFRLFDGTVYERVGVSQFRTELVPSDSAPRLNVSVARPPPTAPLLPPVAPDTVRVGANTFLLVDRAYTHAVTLQQDTVFLFDATTSEERSRADSTWIARIFPGRHPVVLVVTDLAWPHISGVRFWIARGAAIASHRASEGFLRKVAERHWTLKADALEGNPTAMRFRFRAVDDSLRLAGGRVVVHALRNTSTETAVGVWVPGDRFFWAGDYLQGSAESPYARDVVATIRALRLEPLKVGAQHVPQSEWSALGARYPMVGPIP